MKAMLLIGMHSVVTHWSNLIHSWKYWWLHSCIRCGIHIFPCFSWGRIPFNKYCSGGITCALWLSFTINDFSVSDLIFFEFDTSLISLTQAVYFYCGMNTLKEWVLMYHLRQVLHSASLPFPVVFLREGVLSRSIGSDAFSGQKSVWIINKAAFFARFIQYLSLIGMVKMSSMNPSIDYSLDSMFTTMGSTFERWSADCYLSSSGSRFICGELWYVVSHDSSLSRWFLRSIAYLQMVVYSDGAVVVPKGIHMQIKAS